MQRFDLSAAWERLAAMIQWIVALYGGPAEIAQRLCFLRKDRQHFLAWLAPLEALARRLLFIEAAVLPAPNRAPAVTAAGRIANAYTDEPRAELPEDPKRWRVVFRVGPSSARRAAPSVLAPRGFGAIANALPLARRLEALLRLMENRTRALARLARRLHASPKRCAAAFAPYRHRARFATDALHAAQTEADIARARFADTS
ncbi:MAG: hypothetical protein AB7M12_00165 [Hyphomonadaceae bacterium]